MVYISVYKYYINSDPQSQNRFEFLTQDLFVFLFTQEIFFFKKSVI